MKKQLHILALTALFFTALSVRVQAQMNTFWADTLNEVFAQCRLDESMKGAAASVVFSDGSVWTAAEGNHGTLPLSTDYLYDIGSNTKTMISAIILLLQEEGALALDDSLYAYINPVQNVPYGITLKQLLLHTSGVFSYTEHPNFAPQINTNETQFWHPDSILTQFLNPPHFAPGATFRYSNTGYLLLGKVIEAVENQPLNQVLRTRLFNPMGLTNIYLDQYDAYTQVKTGAWLNPNLYYGDNFISFMSSAWAAGGVVTAPAEFALYAHQLYRGDVLSPASMAALTDDETRISVNSYYGLGVIRTEYNGRTYLGHGGTTLQNSEMEYSLDSDFSLAIMNLDQGFTDETSRMKFKMIDLLEYIEEVHDSVANPLSVGESLALQVEFNAYPNPSRGSMRVEVTDREVHDLQLEIYDLSGRRVYAQRLDNGAVVLTADQLGRGVFVARLSDGQGRMETKQLIFQ